MNYLFTIIGWSLIFCKLAALIALLFFAKQPVKNMLFGKPSADWREQVEHSLLIVAFISFSFHFLGRLISDSLLNSQIDVALKRQLYYFFFALYEVIYLTIIIKLHKTRNCLVAKYSRVVCYLSCAMATLLLLRYVDRVLLETNFLDSYYGLLVAAINFTTVCCIGAYPAYRIMSLKPDKEWV